MASVRKLINRRKSVANIRKITRTMEMISTARFRKSMDKALAGKPYTESITELVAALAGSGIQAGHPLLQRNRQSRRDVVLVLTSNRGLCGGYNGNIIRLAGELIKRLEKRKRIIELRVSGRKGVGLLKFRGCEIAVGYRRFDEKTSFADMKKLTDEFIDLYAKKEIDSLNVVYTFFESAAGFYPKVKEILPFTSVEHRRERKAHRITSEDYLFTPNAEEILNELLPTAIQTQLFQCFNDAAVSEQIARMRAMKAATDNAEQMIRGLSQQFNRVRQTNITSAMLDIIGGVEAVK